jgi:HEAT repeat protein
MLLRCFLIIAAALLFAGMAASQMTKEKSETILVAINELGIAGEQRIEDIQFTLLEIGDDAVPYLIRALESSPDAKVRYQVALILGNMRTEKAVQPLFVASQLDRSKTVREGAQLGLENLLVELNERRMTDSVYRVYGKVTRSMALAMKKAMKNDPESEKRANAATALGKYGKKSDIEDILQMVLDEKTPEVRIAMLEAVERLAYPEMLQGNYRIIHYRVAEPGYARFRIHLTDQFLYIIENDKEDEVKQAAIISLTRLVYPIFVLGEGRLSKLQGFFDEHKFIIQRVIEKFTNYALDDDYRQIRSALIESVMQLLNAYFRRGDTSLNDELRRRLTTEVYDFRGDYAYGRLPYTVRINYEKRFTYTPLKQSGLADRARKAFVYILQNDREVENRRLAATAFSTLGVKADANDIIKALGRENDPEVWLAAIDALGKIDSLTAIQFLYGIAVSPNFSVSLKTKAIFAIALIDDAETTRALAAHYGKEKDGAVKKAIIEAMRFEKDEKTAAFLHKILDDEDADFRRAAVESLAENTFKPAIPKLRELLKNDTNATIRAAVIPCLKKNNPENAAKDIIEALADISPVVRRAAAVELGIMKEKKSSRALAEVMRKDPDEGVRLESARSLGYAGDQYSVQPLVDAIIYDDSEEVWQEALRSLIQLDIPRMGIVAIMNLMPEVQRKNPDAAARLHEAEYYLRLQWEGYDRQN